MSTWQVVTSKKAKRQGEYFLQRNGKFVLKIYKDAAVPNVEEFAQWLTKQLNAAEEAKQR